MIPRWFTVDRFESKEPVDQAVVGWTMGILKFFDRLLLARDSGPESNTQWIFLYVINLYFAWIQVRQLYNGKRKALIDSLVLLASLHRDNNIEVQALMIFLNSKLLPRRKAQSENFG